MGVVFRQSVKTTIVIAVGAMLGAFINYAYSFVITEQELGYLRVLLYQAAVLHIVLLLGTSITIANFIPRYEPKSDKSKVLLTIGFALPLCLTLLLLLPYFIFKEQILQFFKPQDRLLAAAFYNYTPILIFLWSYMMVLEHYFIAKSKVAIFSFSREVLLRIVNIMLLGLLFFHYISYFYFIICIISSYALNVLFLFVIAFRTNEFGISLNSKAFSPVEYKEIAQYSWYHMLVSASLNLLGYIDAFILAAYGLSSLAVYGHAIFINSIMAIPYKAMRDSSLSTINRAYIEGDQEKLTDLFHRSSINVLLAATAMFLLIACNLDNLIAILPKGYEDLKPIVLIMMIGRMVDMSTGLNTEVTSISKYYKFNFRISIVLLVALVGFCIMLIPQYGIYGAAWGTTIALVLFNLAKMIFLWVKMRLQPFTSRSMLVIVAGAITFLAGYYMPYVMNPIADTFVRSLLIVVLYTGLLIWLKPSADLNQYLKTIRENKRLF